VRRSRATSFDIAEAAGVSQSTVSRALSGSGLVSEQTRRKVIRAAQSLNYAVDVNARNLRSRSTRTLALLLHEDPAADASAINPFFLAMLGAVTRAAAERRYDVVVSFQQASADWVADYGHAKRADGFLFLGYGDYLGWVEKMRALEAVEAPCVTWGPVLPDQPGVFVGSDNVGGARAATEHLLRLGRDRIVFVGDTSARNPEFRHRYQGFLAASLANARAQTSVDAETTSGSSHARGRRMDHVPADNGEHAGREAVERLLAEGRDFDALFCASDLIAVGALRALRSAGLRTPADVAVVGFDDLHAAAWTSPALTTVRQDTAAAGRALVEALLAVIAGRPAASQLVPTDLVVRESCGQRAASGPA
jgi:DNA-binding LacI/PurR family transcriptional regulator